jgi:transcriptional regulator with XRE-family HTH domain
MNMKTAESSRTEYMDKPMAQKKPDLATHITKHARHQLTRFCLASIRYEYADMPLTRKKRGRPTSPENHLATALNVSPRTVRRWASGKDAIQSSDTNAEKLAELAYSYNPEETTRILQDDAEQYRMTVEAWIGSVKSNSVTCPCPEKQADINPRVQEAQR